MRFAYIDSQGNEVSIPSVDALALRIELGAIGPDTELYDAQADRWGPAQTHEIFHTLSRDVGGEGGFVAPPPPVSAPGGPEAGEPETAPDAEEVAPEVEASPPVEEDEAGKPEFDLAGGLELEGAGEDEEEAPVASPPAPDDGGLGFDLTLTDDPASAPAEPTGTGEAPMDLAPAAPAAPDAGGAEAEGEGDAFDFGGFGELELEAPLAEEEPEAALPEPADSGGGGAMDFSPGAGGMEFEKPMSEFTSDDAPSWMEQDGPDAPSADGGAMDFRPGSGHDEDEHEAPPRARVPAADASDDDAEERRERPEPRSRPSPPRRRKSFPTGAVLGVIALIALAGGGYYVWDTFLKGSDAGGGEAAQPVALPAVTIPDIPAELLPVMRDLGEAALVDMINELRGMQTQFGLPAEPRNDWLAGVYLANASQFRDVQEYWEGIEAYVDRVREEDTRVFHDKYVAQLAIAEITGDTAAILLERADSGFLATRNARFEAYALMDDLVNAALDLHRFLILNEANIEFAPAAGGVSRDPVLEAVPATRELGDEMWDMVDRITGALDALGTLDRVTTERLTAVLFDRIRRAGFQ